MSDSLKYKLWQQALADMVKMSSQDEGVGFPFDVSHALFQFHLEAHFQHLCQQAGIKSTVAVGPDLYPATTIFDSAGRLVPGQPKAI